MPVREALWQHPTTQRSLFYRLHQPRESRGLIVLIHGFGEHGGRYDAMASALVEHSWSVACIDLWGHGRSAGQRGDIERFTQYLDDLEALTTMVLLPSTAQNRYTLFGHSLGGLLALAWAIRGVPPACRCVIVQSPLLGVGYPVPQWKTLLVGALERIWPRLSLPIGLDPTWLSHDGEVVRRYRTDPLVHHRMTLRSYVALQVAIQHAREEAHRITRPTLMMYGTKDRVISLEACQEVFHRLTCPKHLKTFEGCYHELHFEPVQTQVIDEIIAWINTHG